jgi:hypothetical protein
MVTERWVPIRNIGSSRPVGFGGEDRRLCEIDLKIFVRTISLMWV